VAKQIKRKARKDYPDVGIRKGDHYYYADVKTGPRSKKIIRSLTPIPQSQLTMSEFKQGWYGAKESLEAADPTEDVIRQVAEDIKTLGEETQERYDNMPEGLQAAEGGQQLEARVDACEQVSDELDSIADRFPSTDDDKDGDDDNPEDLLTEAIELFNDNEPD